MKISPIVTLLLTLNVSLASELQSFKTDYCTGYAEGTSQNPRLWAGCCQTHDLYYWAGGVPDQRKNADKGLRSCVLANGGGIHASIIYHGVIVGGFSPFKLKSMQWGNAWGKKVRRLSLTENEILALEAHLIRHSTLDQSEIDLFIDDLMARSREQNLELIGISKI